VVPQIQAEILSDRQYEYETSDDTGQKPQRVVYRLLWGLPRSSGPHVAEFDLLLSASRNLDNGVFERLGRYEAALWRQIVLTPFALQTVRHR
jgi:hypothetical protein